jgi:hypothetical protein
MMLKPTLKVKKIRHHPRQTRVMKSVVSLKPTFSYNAPPAIGARICPIEKKVP